MKIIAQLKNPVALLLDNGEQLSHFTPHVVTYSEQLNLKALKGEFKIYAFNLSDEATDGEFQKFYKDSGDIYLAADSFASKYKLEGDSDWDMFKERIDFEKAPISAPAPTPEQVEAEKKKAAEIAALNMTEGAKAKK